MSAINDSVDFLTAIRSELDGDLSYSINDGRVKKAYIFNHFMFNKGPNNKDAPGERFGTEKDNIRIKQCLSQRGFEIECFQDAYKRKVVDTLINASELKKSDVSCIVVVIMSHGDRNIIYARDMSYPLSVLFSPFMRKTCDLDGVPKLFFIQACRGGNLDDGRLELDGSTESIPYEIPPSPDMLCMFSTAKEYLSWRNHTNGSWFIQSLCHHLEKNEGKDIFHLLTLVHNQVATAYASSTNDPRTSNKKQMTHIESTLTKLLYF